MKTTNPKNQDEMDSEKDECADLNSKIRTSKGNDLFDSMNELEDEDYSSPSCDKIITK